MNALCFGAGNIGRGFLGQLLWEGGFETCFMDIDEHLIDCLNRRGEYPLRLVDGFGPARNLKIGDVRGIAAIDTARVVEAFAAADIVLTSVGVGALPRIAPVLAQAIAARRAEGRPVDILLCENQWKASELMRNILTPLIPEASRAFFESRVGLVDVVVGRMVPRPGPAALAEDPLLVIAEPYHALPCAKAMFRAPIPPVAGLEAEEDFEAYVARKLYVQVAGHAAFAYLGYPRHPFLWQCVEDRRVRAAVEPALDEAERAMAAKFSFTLDELRAFTAEMIERYRNQALGDTVERVAQDPMRKLRPDDRLVGAANLCLERGVRPAALARVIAAALRYDNPRDPSAVAMQAKIKELGLPVFLAQHCGIPPDSELAEMIITVG
jgi:mannitol-1-phosphate 5-dehydrogenase